MKAPSFNFVFNQKDRASWPRIEANFLAKLFEFRTKAKKDWQIMLKNYSPKRSGCQLRAYWALVRVIRCYMNDDCGNDFTDEEVSDFIKLEAGHFKKVKRIARDENGWPLIDEIGGPAYEIVKLPRSISDQSKTTVEEMKRILNFILEFGIEHGLPDCTISKFEEEEMLNYYR